MGLNTKVRENKKVNLIPHNQVASIPTCETFRLPPQLNHRKSAQHLCPELHIQQVSNQRPLVNKLASCNLCAYKGMGVVGMFTQCKRRTCLGDEYLNTEPIIKPVNQFVGACIQQYG